MATREIKVCDCCKKEHDLKSDYGRNYGVVSLNFEKSYHLQTDYTQELCGLCSSKIEEIIKNKLNELRGAK
jgi:hypothetical protein